MGIPELLAPAGSRPALNAAVRAGADAVYLGLDRFNARRNADNFTLDALEEACDYAHLRGVRVYVTMNTLILADELQDASDLSRQAYRAGADAFIVQDLGLAAGIARTLPEGALHISTQMNIHSADGLRAAAQLGASRVTLARELSLDEIAHLVALGEELGVECEVFGHGALCVCYSGQCLMSSMIGGRSANRGLCAQACRLPYSLVNGNEPDKELRCPGEFLLSPKDLMTAERLDELAKAGVASLKVEGRMKSAEYVFAVVSVYRHVLDRLSSSFSQDAQDRLRPGREEGSPASLLSPEERETLGSVFSRGFTDGYLDGESGPDLMSFQRPNNRGQFAGRVKAVSGDEITVTPEVDLVPGDLLEFWTRKGNVRIPIPTDAAFTKRSCRFSAEETRKVRAGDRVFRIRSAEAAFVPDDLLPRVPVKGEAWLELGKPLRMEFTPLMREEGAGPEHGCAEGPEVEPARTRAVTVADVEEHVGRMGSTPFQLASLDVHLDEGVGIGFSQIHQCRTHALEDLQARLLEPYRNRVLPKAVKRTKLPAKPAQACLICAWATSPETARAAKRTGADVIYVPALNYQRGAAEVAGLRVSDADQAGYPKGCVIALPSINHDEQGASAEAKRHLDPWKNVTEGTPVLVGSLGALERAVDRGCIVEVDARLPLVNPEALQVAQAFGAEGIWLSSELNLTQIAQLAEDAPVALGAKVYGAQELMVTEHCLLTSQGPCAETCATCSRRRVPFSLKDRKGYLFPVVTDEAGRSHLYNAVTTDLVPELPALIRCGITRFMVDTTLMDVEQTSQAIGRVKHALKLALDSGETVPKMPNTTSGHLHRGIQ